MNKKTERKEKIHTIKLFRRLFALGWKAAPGLLLAINGISIIQGVQLGLIPLVMQHFFDRATGLARGEETLAAVLTALLIYIGMLVAKAVIEYNFNWLPQILYSIGIRETSLLIHDKLTRVSPECFEDTEFLDGINKAKAGKDYSFQLIFKIMIMVSYYLPYLITMVLYLNSVKPVFIILIVIIFIPSTMAMIFRTRVYTKLEDDSAPIRRENEYYDKCITATEYFKETRILGAFRFFIDMFVSNLRAINKMRIKTGIKVCLLELSVSVTSLLGYLGILYLLFTSLMAQEISVGMFAAVYASISMLYRKMDEIMDIHLKRVNYTIGNVNNIIKFLDHDERCGEDIHIERSAQIVADNISFKYPGSESYAIKDVSFTIEPNETVAIVGENGSGKSTLIKLITGIYLPEDGAVLIGGNDSKKVSMRSFFENVSVVFQRYQKYKLILKENIAISSIEEDMDDNRLDTSCEMAGFNKNDNHFNNGYDTMLSREFDGIEISGGQWQRVAIARGFYRDYDMIILDEPTAAIDPIEESKVYNRFAQLSKDKTAFIVTHRLGSVRLADRIMVLSKGKLIETGKHEDLLKNDGEYARMYKAQQKWYM